MAAKKVDKPNKNKAVVAQQSPDSSFSIARIKDFFAEVKVEFGKIVWPDRKVTMGSTGVVIVLVFIISMYLGAVDLIIGKIVTRILN